MTSRTRVFVADDASLEPRCAISQPMPSNTEVAALLKLALQECGMKDRDEDDVRVWLRTGGGDAQQQQQEWKLADDDSASGSDNQQDLPEQIPDTLKTPTLLSVLGPIGDVELDMLLDMRREDGTWSKKAKDGGPPSPVVVLPSTVASPPYPTPPPSTTPPLASTGGATPTAVTTKIPITPFYLGGPAPLVPLSLSSPRPEQILDAQREVDSKWYESRVVKLVPPNSIVVHFLSFPQSCDETIPLESPRISAPFTKVPAWRYLLKVDEDIDVHRSAISTKRFGGKLLADKGQSAWVMGTVKRVIRVDEGAHSPPRVLLHVRTGPNTWNSQFKPIWLHLTSEKMAPRFTHQPRPKQLDVPSTVGAPSFVGAVGFRNLGNTCYMNSLLQCLSHDKRLADFVMSNEYETDLNRTSHMSCGGELAESFAEVVRGIWSSNLSVVAPTTFKYVLGKHFPMFQGYHQQDAHEVFVQLVDGLSEDLNRIKVKVPVAEIESTGKTDQQLALETRAEMLKQKDSKIQDEIYALSREYALCPQCGHKSVKFSSNSCLMLPIPSVHKVRVLVVFLPLPSLLATMGVTATATTTPTAPPPLPQPILLNAAVSTRATTRDIAEWISNKFPHTGGCQNIVISDLWECKPYNTWLFFADVDRRKEVRTLDPHMTLIAWQIDSRATVDRRALAVQKAIKEAELARQTLEDEKWAEFMSRYESLRVRPKELFHTWMTELGGPNTQRRLVKELLETAIVSKEQHELVSVYPAYVLGEFINHLRALQGKAVDVDELEQAVARFNTDRATLHANLAAGSESTQGKKKKEGGLLSRGYRKLVGRGGGAGNNNNNSQQDAGGASGEGGGAESSQREESQQSVQVVEPANVRLVFEVRHCKASSVTTALRLPHMVCHGSNESWGQVRASLDRIVNNMLGEEFHNNKNGEVVVAAPADGTAITPPSATPLYSYSIVSGTGRADVLPMANDRLGPDANVGKCLAIVWSDVAIENWKKLSCIDGTKYGLDDAHVGFSMTGLEADEESLKDWQPKPFKNGFEDTNGATATDASTEQPTRVTLAQCFEQFRGKETLDQDNLFCCPKCKAMVQATKQIELWNAPLTLVISLKRFLYEKSRFGERAGGQKITECVDFPLEGFDLSPFLADPASSKTPVLYDLFAVSNHMGALGGGHYTAYVKIDAQWFLMDDAIATRVEPKDVVTEMAYVLFFRKRE